MCAYMIDMIGVAITICISYLFFKYHFFLLAITTIYIFYSFFLFEFFLRLQDKDPFYDDYDSDFHIGSIKVWLKSLAYMIDMKEQLEITNFSGQEVGLVNVRFIS